MPLSIFHATNGHCSTWVKNSLLQITRGLLILHTHFFYLIFQTFFWAKAADFPCIIINVDWKHQATVPVLNNRGLVSNPRWYKFLAVCGCYPEKWKYSQWCLDGPNIMYSSSADKKTLLRFWGRLLNIFVGHYTASNNSKHTFDKSTTLLRRSEKPAANHVTTNFEEL